MQATPRASTDAVLDAGPTACGDLILLVFQTIRSMSPGQTLLVIAHDEGAAIDIPAWCRSTGNALVGADLTKRPAEFVIQRRPS